jgi:UDP-N-acetyl-D-glucosamine dehydrogenase
VTYSDPYVPRISADGIDLSATEAAAGATAADCVVIVTDHKGFDYAGLVRTARLIVDTRNALKGIVSEKIVRL